MEVVLKFASLEEAEVIMERLQNIEELLELLLENTHVAEAIREQAGSKERE
jgi:hypothetical protein